VTLHESENALPFAGTFFAGSPEDAFQFALTLRPAATTEHIWIRLEHMPCYLIFE
jgi:hypothetical protein